jgi:hypothetical protein
MTFLPNLLPHLSVCRIAFPTLLILSILSGCSESRQAKQERLKELREQKFAVEKKNLLNRYPQAIPLPESWFDSYPSEFTLTFQDAVKDDSSRCYYCEVEAPDVYRQQDAILFTWRKDDSVFSLHGNDSTVAKLKSIKEPRSYRYTFVIIFRIARIEPFSLQISAENESPDESYVSIQNTAPLRITGDLVDIIAVDRLDDN